MRVVLDTNVLLSALLSSHGLPDTIYRAWQKDRFDLVTSVKQIDELRRASRYPKFKEVLQPHRVGTMVNNLRRAIMLDLQPHLSRRLGPIRNLRHPRIARDPRRSRGRYTH